METVSREELKRKMDGGETFTLVETLQEVAFRHEHLPGAVNLPPDRVRELGPGLLPDKGAEIIVYCSSPTWHASENVARELAAMGYTNVKDYAGGKSDWIEAGLPTESEHRHQRG